MVMYLAANVMMLVLQSH